MRLINADVENSKLLDFIAENDMPIQCALERKDMTMLEDIFFEYFESQSTAYDVDKVVKQLEELPEKIYDEISEDEGSGYYYNAYREGIQRAIEIVKSGMKG